MYDKLVCQQSLWGTLKRVGAIKATSVPIAHGTYCLEMEVENGNWEEQIVRSVAERSWYAKVCVQGGRKVPLFPDSLSAGANKFQDFSVCLSLMCLCCLIRVFFCSFICFSPILPPTPHTHTHFVWHQLANSCEFFLWFHFVTLTSSIRIYHKSILSVVLLVVVVVVVVAAAEHMFLCPADGAVWGIYLNTI